MKETGREYWLLEMNEKIACAICNTVNSAYDNLNDRLGEKLMIQLMNSGNSFKRGSQRSGASRVLHVRHFYFQDKQCDDDYKDPVRKCFDPAFTENRFH